MQSCKRRGCDKIVINNPQGKIREYCSIKCKNIDHVDKYRKRKKQELIDLLGGKCSICGYNKCMAALEFHHIDPTKKDFTITTSINLNSSKVLEEVKKCNLLCANCHREVHYGTVT